MPTYDYLCPNGHRFEVIHSVSGSGPDACPVCGAGPVRKAFSAPTIHFKGSGWAKKDRSTSSRPAAGAATSSGDDGAKTDSAPKADGAGSTKETSGGTTDAAPSSKSGSSSGTTSSSGTAAD